MAHPDTGTRTHVCGMQWLHADTTASTLSPMSIHAFPQDLHETNSLSHLEVVVGEQERCEELALGQARDARDEVLAQVQGVELGHMVQTSAHRAEHGSKHGANCR